MIWLSCGCKVEKVDDGIDVTYRTHSRGERAIAYATFCQKCKNEWEARGDLLSTYEEGRKWLEEEVREGGLLVPKEE